MESMNNFGRRLKLGILLGITALILIIVCAFFKDEENKKALLRNQTYSSSRFETLKVKIEKEKLSLGCYPSNDGMWYAFLPSFCDGKLADNVKLVTSSDDNSVIIDYKEIGAGDNYTDYTVSFLQYGKDTSLESGILRVMHSNNLPSIYIDTESGELNYIDEDKDHFENMDATILDANGNLVYREHSGIVKGHGNRSFAQPKKPYTMTFSKEVPMFGMHSSDKWILISNVCDSSGIQNAITYNMARKAGMQYVPEFQYVDLYFNSMYHGTYLLVEKIEIREEKMNFNNLNRLNRGLNPGIDTQLEARWFEEENTKGYFLDKNPVDITGGYILERDYGDKFAAETTGFVTDALQECYVVKDPSLASKEQLEYIRNLMNQFEDSLLKNDGSVEQYIDIDSFADKYVIEEFTQNEGGGSTSAFYYKPQDSVSKLIYAGPVWDYDTSYALFGQPNRLSYSAIHPFSPTKLYYLLYQNETFRDKVTERYKSFYSQYIENGLQEDILNYSNLCGASFAMNAVRWEELWGTEYLAAVEKMQDYIRVRKQFLDSVWLEGEPIVNVRFCIDTREWNFSVIPGTCVEPPLGVDERFWVNSASGKKFDRSIPVYESQEYNYVEEQ